MYCAYGLACAFLFAQILRSVVGDLYGRRLETATQQSPTACLEDIERLYGQISARAGQPAPGGDLPVEALDVFQAGRRALLRSCFQPAAVEVPDHAAQDLREEESAREPVSAVHRDAVRSQRRVARHPQGLAWDARAFKGR